MPVESLFFVIFVILLLVAIHIWAPIDARMKSFLWFAVILLLLAYFFLRFI